MVAKKMIQMPTCLFTFEKVTDKIICGLAEEDISEHLKVRLRKEQEEKEYKKREKAEACMLTELKVARDSDSKEQTARPNLMEFDKVHSFHAPKNMSINEGHGQVCIIYHERMLLHTPPADGTVHHERLERLTVILKSLEANGLLNSCALYNSEKAEIQDVQYCHDEAYIQDILSHDCKELRKRIEKDGDMYFSPGTADAVMLAAGGAIKACSKVINGEHRYAFAIIRPPGHHAKKKTESGFCFLNNVAIAARYLINKHNVPWVLIVDFDVHHGNGTQQIFYGDPQVLFISLHRYPFYPHPYDQLGSEGYIGKGQGRGFNFNICWEEEHIGDDDLYAAWQYAVMPRARHFAPDFILVSAGFDAAVNDPLGNCCVSPQGFATVLNQLVQLNRSVVMILEGGYNLDILGDCASACVKVLTSDTSDANDCLEYCPFASTWKRIEKARKIHAPFCNSLSSPIPLDVCSRIKILPSTRN